MAIPKSTGGSQSSYKNLYNMIDGVVESSLNSLPSKSNAKAIAVSVESFAQMSGFDPETYANNYESLRGQLGPVAIKASQVAVESDNILAGHHVTGAQGDDCGGEATGYAVPFMRNNQERVAVEAGALLMQAHNNVAAYYASEKDMAPFADASISMQRQVVTGNAGSIPVIPSHARPNMESFDEKVTDDWRQHSYSIAMTAAKQHEFCELFYKTQILSPDQAGFIMTIRRNVVWDGWQATDLKGDAVANTKRNVLEGLLDHKVLETNTTDLIPCIQDGENEDFFIDPTLVAPEEVNQGDESYETNFLKFGAEGLNLIRLGQTPSRLQKGTPNHTDSLDSRIALDQIVISVKKGSVTEAISFNVNRSNNAQYLATREYNGRDTTVKFITNSLPINKETVLHNRNASVNLAPLLTAQYRLELGLIVDGEVNVEFGNASNRVTEVVIKKAFNAEGKEVALTDATLAPLIAGLTFKAEGYKLEARLTNINQLERGLLIDSDVWKHGFMIPTLSPLCIQKPSLTDEEKVYPKMEALQNTYRLQLRNAGVTALLNRADTLLEYLGNDISHPLESQPGLEGLGQYYVRPYFFKRTVDVLNELNSTNSGYKLEDIQGLFTGVIQESIRRADMKTGYSSALEQAFPGSNPKPHVAIGTDKRLSAYLMTQGDDRTAGVGFNFTVATISDLRMVDKVIMTFTLPNQTEIHPLDHGILGMIPEYIVNFAMIREQRIANEIRLTPRYRHFHFLPIMIVLDVVNLEAAIAKRTEYDVNNNIQGVVKTEAATVTP